MAVLALDVELLHCACVLALSPGPFTLDFAASLLGKNGIAQLEVGSILRRLHNRRLISHNDAASTYAFHPLIRDILRLLSEQPGTLRTRQLNEGHAEGWT